MSVPPSFKNPPTVVLPTVVLAVTDRTPVNLASLAENGASLNVACAVSMNALASGSGVYFSNTFHVPASDASLNKPE